MSCQFLPPIDFNQRDPRIKAVIAINPVTSTALGPESMGKIDIPTMLLGGSKDIAAPFVMEQAHPFLWLKTQNKYLGLMAGGTHGYEDNKEQTNSSSGLFANPSPKLRRSYLKAMSLAFFESYLGDSQSERTTNYQAYLSPTYAQYISDRKLPLHLIESLTPEQLELAYGDTPPTPPIPKAISLTASLRNATSLKTEENALAQIRNTKTLKVAMRNDTAPFSYVDGHENEWTGYCGDLADSLGEYLEQRLNIAAGIKVIKLSSSLENRFELVRDNTVHLECGPNTITANKQDTTFSNPFLISGTRFLVPKDNADIQNQSAGIKVGVLQDTTTADFLQSNYPQAEAVYFQGKQGSIKAVEAVTDGNIDAFINDGVLLQGEIERQNLPFKNYLLTPEQPLSCNFYGLILPEGQNNWKSLVNDFIASKNRVIQNQWFQDYSTQTLSDADYCLNRLTE